MTELEGRELDAKMATEVMGWTAERKPGLPHLWLPLGHFISGWRPSRDITDAMQVHLAMCKSDPSTKARYFHALKDLLMEHGSFSIWTAALEYFDPLTICRAALMAAEAGE